MNWKYMLVPLSRPIKLGENNFIREIKLREPDIRALETLVNFKPEDGHEPTISQLRGMIVALSDEGEGIILQLHPADARTLGEAVKQLLLASAT